MKFSISQLFAGLLGRVEAGRSPRKSFTLRIRILNPLFRRGLACACLCAALLLTAAQDTVLAQSGVRLKVLVLSATGAEPSHEGIVTFLDFLGVPYDTLIATRQDLTPAMLADGSGGKYQAVILTTDSLGFFDGASWRSALDAAEWQTLWNYQAAYRVRQVTYYTYPGSQYGLGTPVPRSTDQTPLTVRLTATGRSFFSYLKPDTQIPVRYAYAYLAPVIDPATQSLVEDERGNAIVSVRSYPDGRENLAVTVDNWRYLLHSQLLSYGIIHWATRGIHLGERTVYLMPQVDDIYLANELFDPALGFAHERRTYRINDKDMKEVEKWQNTVRDRRDPSFQHFGIEMIFNGEGAQDPSDSLVKYFKDKNDEYQWVSHTWSHLNFNDISYSAALQELQLNDQAALNLKFAKYRKNTLVTGEVSGLNNPNALKAMADFGIRYIVSDSSKPGQGSPSPNAGIYNPYQPSILMIPRRPTNIFTLASTEEEEVGLYNAVYRTFWGRNFTLRDILDFESDLILSYMASYDMSPLMFHQSNLRIYSKKRFLLGDLLDTVIDKYCRYMILPVISPSMERLGQRMAQRMNYNQAGVEAVLIPNSGIWLTAKKAVVVPITGVRTGSLADVTTFAAGTHRNYGGQITSWIQLKAGQTVWIPLTATGDAGGDDDNDDSGA